MNVPILDLGRTRRRIAGELDERWRRVLEQSSFILGPEVREFEAAFASYLGVEACAGLANGTDALILALRAGHAKGGDRRWGSLQSAALRIADPNDPGRGGDRVSIAIDVGTQRDSSEVGAQTDSYEWRAPARLEDLYRRESIAMAPATRAYEGLELGVSRAMPG